MLSTIQKHGRALHALQKSLVKSRFFTISLLLHIILVLLLGGTVLFNKYVEPPDFEGGEGEGGFVSPEAQTNQPPQAAPQQPTMTVSTPQTPTTSLNAITANAAMPATFTMPTVMSPTLTPSVNNLAQTAPAAAPTSASGMSAQIASGIAGFSGGWAKGGKGRGPGTSIQSREFVFTAYLAKYAGGDWDSTVQMRDGKIWKGSLPNLLYVIDKLSRDKIHTDTQTVPLNLSNWDEIWAKKPPFILFTGHRDFVLTDKEVENLQKYIRLGGCIWGDSSLPGQHSRFDLAFRREMRRVVPDVDKKFEPLPPNHPIYTNAYYPEIREVPPGINFYKEPVYALKIYGEIAILYTANDYGDMWQFAIDEKKNFDTRSDDTLHQFVAMNDGMWWNGRGVYLRNIEAPSVYATYQFGTNIIVHLLTRWEDKVRTAPKGL
jgi:hypothetical protein